MAIKERKHHPQIYSRKELLKELAEYLLVRASSIGSLAEKDALFYYFSGKKKRKNFEDFLGVYQRFHDLKSNHNLRSLESIGKPYGISPFQVGRMLKSREYIPLNGKLDIHRLPKNKIKKLKKAIKIQTPLSYVDMSRVLKIPPYTIGYWARHNGIEKPHRFLAYCNKNRERISYGQALDFLELCATGADYEESLAGANLESKEAITLILSKAEKAINAFQELTDQIDEEIPWDINEITSNLKVPLI